MQAKRDMTRAEFRKALAARGWRSVLGGWIDIGGGTSIGMVMLKGPAGYKINRRASLARAIREADAIERKAA